MEITPTQEFQAVCDALDVAAEHDVINEVVWSALQASGTVKEKLEYGLSEWVK